MKRFLKSTLVVISLVFTVIWAKNSLKAQGQMYCEWSPAICEVIYTQCPDGSYKETRIMGVKKIPFQQ